ncbi:hypothetical protein L7F22_037061 [Adiantum nelumboides]|nr:hypothetical protein [Adiantum nelumboides]
MEKKGFAVFKDIWDSKSQQWGVDQRRWRTLKPREKVFITQVIQGIKEGWPTNPLVATQPKISNWDLKGYRPHDPPQPWIRKMAAGLAKDRCFVTEDSLRKKVKQTWKATISRRYNLLLWRITARKIPVNVVCSKWGAASPYCPRCFTCKETVKHAFWDCKCISPTWRSCSGILENFGFTERITWKQALLGFKGRINPAIMDIWQYIRDAILSKIWQDRNLIAHRKPALCFDSTKMRLAMVEGCLLAKEASRWLFGERCDTHSKGSMDSNNSTQHFGSQISDHYSLSSQPPFSQPKFYPFPPPPFHMAPTGFTAMLNAPWPPNHGMPPSHPSPPLSAHSLTSSINSQSYPMFSHTPMASQASPPKLANNNSSQSTKLTVAANCSVWNYDVGWAASIHDSLNFTRSELGQMCTRACIVLHNICICHGEAFDMEWVREAEAELACMGQPGEGGRCAVTSMTELRATKTIGSEETMERAQGGNKGACDLGSSSESCRSLSTAEKRSLKVPALVMATNRSFRREVKVPKVKLNHQRLLDGILEICGVPAEKFRTICSAINKLDKLTWDDVRKEMVTMAQKSWTTILPFIY